MAATARPDEQARERRAAVHFARGCRLALAEMRPSDRTWDYWSGKLADALHVCQDLGLEVDDEGRAS